MSFCSALVSGLQGSENAAQFQPDIENTKAEVQHNASTRRPQEIVTLAEGTKIDWEHANWISSVLAWIPDVKPGMTRKDLIKVFTTEGGLSNRSRRTYVLKQCPTSRLMWNLLLRRTEKIVSPKYRRTN
jgi:hypothetical protein